MAANRAAKRDLVIPDPRDPERRAACEADDCLWLQTYCAEVFYNPFTPHQQKIIRDCAESLRYGTAKCKAAPRGDGKSSIVKYLALKYALCRQVRFPLIVAATTSKAKKILSSLERRLAARGQSALAEDYPLECHVARYVHPWPSRARNVTANGGRAIHVEWASDHFILPTWEDEEPLGPILLSLGITSDDLQGCNIYDQRPDFVMLDDLDSRDSLAAEDGVVAGKIEEAIDKTIAGLGGQSRRLGQFMLCTITSRDAAAFKYSDPAQKPAWSGERIAAIVEWPERTDLWDQYIELRRKGKATRDDDDQPIDVFGRQAHQHYLDNREEMDRGAVLANPYNFDTNELPDGTPKEISALQRCYDYIADYGLASFQTEHQNDPPEDSGALESGITPRLVQTQLSQTRRGIIPEGCTALTHSCDIGKHKGCHWVVRAWKPDGTGYTIDYGIMSVQGVKHGSDEGLDRAIYAAVRRREEEFRAAHYQTASGDTITGALSIYDSRYRTDAVFRAVKDIGIGAYAIMGIGHSAGASMRGKFRPCHQETATRKPGGDRWYWDRDNAFRLWTVHADTDYWKAWEHDRWMTAQDRPGCLFLFGDEDTPTSLHEEYAKHICSEVEVEEDGRRFWKPTARERDWLDASYYSDVAAAMKGVRILSELPASKPKPARKRKRVQYLD